MNEIKTLLIKMKKHLKPKGKILIISLNSKKNEIPSFKLMQIKLMRSFDKDKKIFRLISKFYPEKIVRYFSYKVKITKKEFINMISRKFISTLLDFSKEQIATGINEINFKYKIRFKI